MAERQPLRFAPADAQEAFVGVLVSVSPRGRHRYRNRHGSVSWNSVAEGRRTVLRAVRIYPMVSIASGARPRGPCYATVALPHPHRATSVVLLLQPQVSSRRQRHGFAAAYSTPAGAACSRLVFLTEPQRSRRNVVSRERIASSRALQRKPPSQSGHLHILIRLRDLRVSVRVKSF